jgi:hypothetical protein
MRNDAHIPVRAFDPTLPVQERKARSAVSWIYIEIAAIAAFGLHI